MNMQPYRILFGAGLAVLAGTVSAQGDGATTYPGANNGAPPSVMTPPTVMTQPLEQATKANPDSGTARLPATRDMDATTAPGARVARPTAKMSGQSYDQISRERSTGAQGQQPAKQARHTTKRTSQVAAHAHGETIYHQALRQCVKEQDQGQRDSCLDDAIEKFQRNG